MKIRPLVFICALTGLGLTAPLSLAEETGAPGKPKGEWLEPFAHEYYWDVFTVTKEAPFSPDGQFKLKKVLRNGNVELLIQSGGKDGKKILVKPMSAKPKAGDKPPTLVVEQSDPKKQSAVLKELKMR